MATLNDIQLKLEELHQQGWTYAVIADTVGVTPDAVFKWRSGNTYPSSSKAVLVALDTLKQQKAPKR